MFQKTSHSLRKILISLILLLSCIVGVFALEGEVISIVGKAEVKSGDEWIKLNPGDIIKKGAVISTGFKSEVALKIGNSTFIVQALSRITIEQMTEQEGNHVSQMFLDTGSISADIKPAENKRVGFTARSPVATASVRGTSGIVYADGRLKSQEHTWITWKTPIDQQTSMVVEDSGDDESKTTEDKPSDTPGNTTSTDPKPTDEEAPADGENDDATSPSGTGESTTTGAANSESPAPAGATSPSPDATTQSTSPASSTKPTSSTSFDSLFTSAPPPTVKAIKVQQGQSTQIAKNSISSIPVSPEKLAASQATSTGNAVVSKASTESVSTAAVAPITNTPSAAPVEIPISNPTMPGSTTPTAPTTPTTPTTPTAPTTPTTGNVTISITIDGLN